MIRQLLLAGLLAGTALTGLQLVTTDAGVVDTETAGGSFTAEICSEEDCKVVHARGLDDHECNPDEWHFVITQTSRESAPRSIHVTWQDGDATVGLSRVTGQTAHYRTSSYLDQPVEDATARIAEDWDGQFRLGEGPCRG